MERGRIVKSDTDNRRQNIIKHLIREKMKVLSDFNICSKNDENMIKKLEEVICNNPEKDPRHVLDYYCRPMIQAKANSWL